MRDKRKFLEGKRQAEEFGEVVRRLRNQNLISHTDHAIVERAFKTDGAVHMLTLGFQTLIEYVQRNPRGYRNAAPKAIHAMTGYWVNREINNAADTVIGFFLRLLYFTDSTDTVPIPPLLQFLQKSLIRSGLINIQLQLHPTTWCENSTSTSIMFSRPAHLGELPAGSSTSSNITFWTLIRNQIHKEIHGDKPLGPEANEEAKGTEET
jgi:hypothetical protein